MFIMHVTQTKSYYITFYWQKYYIIIIQQISCLVKFFKKQNSSTKLHVNEGEVTAPGEIPWE